MTARGFTLIELLVVVLIVGILAAVAVPQYQRAVGKTRIIGLVSTLTAIKQAEERYYLANGSYTRQKANLDIDFSLEKTIISWPSIVLTTSDPAIVMAREDNLPGVVLAFGLSYSGNDFWNDTRMCYADLNKKVGVKEKTRYQQNAYEAHKLVFPRQQKTGGRCPLQETYP